VLNCAQTGHALVDILVSKGRREGWTLCKQQQHRGRCPHSVYSILVSSSFYVSGEQCASPRQYTSWLCVHTLVYWRLTQLRSTRNYISHASIRSTIATSRRWTMAKLGRYSEVSAHRPSTNVLFEYYPTSLTILRCFPDSTKSSKDHVDEPCCVPTIRCAREQQ
jgi:hypothetical protein